MKKKTQLNIKKMLKNISIKQNPVLSLPVAINFLVFFVISREATACQ